LPLNKKYGPMEAMPASELPAVGGDGAQEALASPIENTLFFAGEATDISGHNGTVHGAIASGRRAASEIQRSLR
jgi:monoamine oxidase